MGGSESKLAFRQGIFRLSEENNIAADDPYWTGFWELPESPDDVFSLFSPADIRRTRDASIANLETLILAVTSRLIVLKNHPSFPDPDLAPDRDALNCIRVLTRILPFIYESENLEAWEEKFFWGRRRKKHRHAQIASQVLFDGASEDDEMRRSNPQNHQNDYYDAKPLAEELIDTLVDLLFYSGFTIPTIPNAKGKVSYSIWQSGVGCTTAMGSNKELESNRCEILRLLLTLSSQSMYMPLSLLPVKGVKTITYLVTCPDKQVVLSLLCSLLNTTIKYNPTPWRLPYDHVVWKDPKQIFVIYCLQFLLVLLLYPIPEDGRGTPPKNYYRHFYGRLHRPQDFQFIVEGMTRILNQPMQATTSYLPGSHKSVKWAPEMIMLFWEALQCNKRFRSYMIDSSRALDFVVLCIFYAIEYKTDASKLGVVKMCIFILQTLSVEPNFGKNLNKKFESQDTLPQSIRLQNFRGSYADFLIISIHTLLTTSKGKLDAVYPALLAIINNISAYCEHLSATTCSKIIQLFSLLSSPSFLLANESNHILLHSLLEFFNSVLEHQYSNNPLLVYSILKSAKRFEALRAFTLESGQEEIERLNQRRKANQISGNSDALLSPTVSHSGDDNRGSGAGRRQLSHVPEDGAFAIGDDDSDEEEQEPQNTPSQSPSRENSRAPSVASAADESVPLQLRGMSEKARGKMPAGQVTFSRQNSTTSLSSYTPTIPTSSGGFAPTSSWIESWVPELPLHTIITLISAITPHIPSSALQSTLNPDARTFISNLPSFAEEPQVHALIAEPSPIRVHLFEWSPLSLGWYESLLWGFIFASEMLVGSASGSTPGAVGVWNGTAIKLFKVQETAAQGPTLLAPKGAVDAVGSNLVQRIGNLNLRGRGSGSQEGHDEARRDV
ncbi:Dymeclin superfamily domain-containing protein [Histoplasma ohiense]|nr:Dymeclin superfamily domain-containing protein [Histoplasma ohiense (nom. inval.)]